MRIFKPVVAVMGVVVLALIAGQPGCCKKQI
jgi:hypothetical protein